ncbi:hypothetical protein [Jatrophihabitans sp.]|uniref:hypothetical protein n=1 Tax=Jatrophihabitans sp. TaxID=1932789 RepID=UPI0030C69C2C|nr:hypothetical protein [Jatrophihabitans sp.]
MSDEALRRVDELLTELVEQVETARTVPMSASVVLPRERVLDLLDELREVLPPEMAEARVILATRDQLLAEAQADAASARESANVAAEVMLADGRHRADELIHAAEVTAYETVEAGKAEHALLVSATGVHSSATAKAAEMHAEAEEYLRTMRDAADRYHDETLAEAQRYSMDVRNQADAYAAKLTADSEAYADHTLAELASTLQRAAATAEQGRLALAARRKRAGSEPDPLTDDSWTEAAVSA